MKKVSEWIEQLQQEYNPTKLNEEAERVNCILNEEEFVKYFKAKDKSTESLPSGRCMGHYKSILHDECIVGVIVAMLNIGLTTGTALERWKWTLSIMLEKDVGSPTLHRLRIIQSFEADYNFLLAVFFGHRLMGFAKRHCNFNNLQYGSMNGKHDQLAILNNILTTTISA